MKTKNNTVAYIRHQLNTNPAWAIKAMVKIYDLYQTADEQISQATHHLNGIGFSGCDANILSSFAQQVKAGRNMSPKQLTIVLKKMPRYVKQVMQFIPAEKLTEIEITASTFTPPTAP